METRRNGCVRGRLSARATQTLLKWSAEQGRTKNVPQGAKIDP